MGRTVSSAVLVLLLITTVFVSISAVITPGAHAATLTVTLIPASGNYNDVILVSAWMATVADGTTCSITDNSPGSNLVTSDGTTYSSTATVSAGLVSGSFIVGTAPRTVAPGYTVTVYCDDGTNSDTGTATFMVTPSITVTPPIGMGGQVITVDGVGFLSSATTCAIAGAPSVGPAICSISGGSVTGSFTVDALAASGVYPIGVIPDVGPFGTATFLKVASPTIVLSPASATPGYGTLDGAVTISGGGFATGSSRPCTVSLAVGAGLFSSSPASTCSISSTGTVTGSFAVDVSAPVGPGYVVRVTDSNPAGVFADSPAFTVLPAPALNAAVPASGPPGTVVTLTTAALFAVQDAGPCTITSSPGGLISLPVCIINAGGGLGAGATFQVSSNAAGGPYTITVTGIHGDSATTLFTVITGPLTLSPTVGSPPLDGEPGTEVTLTGAGFIPSGACTITVSPAPPPGFNLVIDSPTCTVSSSGVLTNAKFTVGAGSTWGLAYNVRVTGPGADFATALLAVSPRLALTPNTGSSGTSVTFSGSGFAGGGVVGPCATYSSAPLGLAAAAPVPVCTRNPDGTVFGSFTVDVAAPQGGYTVVVAGLGPDVATDSFTVGAAPTLTLTPTIGSPAAGTLPATVVQLSGSGFNPADEGPCTVSVWPANPGLITSPTCTITSAGVLSGEFTVGPGTQGAFGWVIIVTGSTNDFDTAPFSVIPQIDLSPRSGPPGTVVTMTGAGFNAADVGVCAACPLSSVPAGLIGASESATITGGTFELTGSFVVQAVPAGMYTVTWLGALGPTIAPIFTVTTPFVAFSPASGSGGDTITISGSGFSPDDNGACALTTIAGTETIESFTCTMTNGVVTGSFLVKTLGNTAQMKTLQVESPSHGIATNTFTVVPKITSLTPNPARVGDTVTITGTNFGVAGGCTISGASVTPISCTVNPDATLFNTQFSVAVTYTALTDTITVTDGIPVSASATLNIVPHVVTLTPPFGPQGTTVSVTGTGFALGDTICDIVNAVGLIGPMPATCSISGGTITGSFQVAPGVPAGSYSVDVKGQIAGPITQDVVTVQFVVTPSLTIAPASGGPGTLVTVLGGNWPAGDNGPCTITSDPSGLISNPSCTIAGGAVAGGFTVAAGATGAYVVTVTGAAGTNGTATFNAPPAPTLTLTPIAGPGGELVTVSGSNYQGSTCLLTSVPGGLFTTSSCALAGGTLTGTFTVEATASVGTAYTVTATTNMGIGDSASAIFTVSAGPVGTLTLTPTSGPVETVVSGQATGFTTDTSCQLTAAPSTILSSSSCTITGAGNANVGFVVSSSADPGPYGILVVGNTGKSAAGTFTVTGTPSFSLSANPSSLALNPGGSANVVVTVQSLSGFDSPVTLDASLPVGVSGGLAPNPVTPPSGGSVQSTLSLAVMDTATSTTAFITVSGTGGGQTTTTSITLIIQTVVVSTTTSAATTTLATATSPWEPPECVIATATFGSEVSWAVQFLRNFRDGLVLSTRAGSAFMEVFNTWYYSFSPSVAKFIATNDPIRAPLRALLYPLLGVLGVSAFTYSLLSATPEFAVVMAGLVASSMIGLVYFTVPALMGVHALQRRRRLDLLSLAKISLASLAIALTLLTVGELAGSFLLLAIASSAVVLTCVIAVPVLVSVALLRHSPK